MGNVLVRCSRDENSAYLIWSTNVDAPTWIFLNRTEAEDHLNEEWRFTHPEHTVEGRYYVPETVNATPGDPLSPAARLERADLRGSSSLHGEFGWDDEEFVCMEVDAVAAKYRVPGTWLGLPRQNLQAFALALLDEDHDAAAELLVVHRYEVDE